MNKFTVGQRVVLDANPSDLMCINCQGVNINRKELYHIKDYGPLFNGEPMVRLKETGSALFLERLFKVQHRRTIVK